MLRPQGCEMSTFPHKILVLSGPLNPEHVPRSVQTVHELQGAKKSKFATQLPQPIATRCVERVLMRSRIIVAVNR